MSGVAPAISPAAVLTGLPAGLAVWFFHVSVFLVAPVLIRRLGYRAFYIT
jgi:hypothetical protein